MLIVNVNNMERYKIFNLILGGRLIHWGSYMNQLATIAIVDPISEVVERMFLFAMALVIVEGLPDARRVNFTLNVSRTNFSIWPNGLRVNLLYWILVAFNENGNINFTLC